MVMWKTWTLFGIRRLDYKGSQEWSVAKQICTENEWLLESGNHLIGISGDVVQSLSCLVLHLQLLSGWNMWGTLAEHHSWFILMKGECSSPAVGQLCSVNQVLQLRGKEGIFFKSRLLAQTNLTMKINSFCFRYLI